MNQDHRVAADRSRLLDDIAFQFGHRYQSAGTIIVDKAKNDEIARWLAGIPDRHAVRFGLGAALTVNDGIGAALKGFVVCRSA